MAPPRGGHQPKWEQEDVDVAFRFKVDGLDEIEDHNSSCVDAVHRRPYTSTPSTGSVDQVHHFKWASVVEASPLVTQDPGSPPPPHSTVRASHRLILSLSGRPTRPPPTPPSVPFSTAHSAAAPPDSHTQTVSVAWDQRPGDRSAAGSAYLQALHRFQRPRWPTIRAPSIPGGTSEGREKSCGGGRGKPKGTKVVSRTRGRTRPACSSPSAVSRATSRRARTLLPLRRPRVPRHHRGEVLELGSNAACNNKKNQIMQRQRRRAQQAAGGRHHYCRRGAAAQQPTSTGHCCPRWPATRARPASDPHPRSPCWFATVSNVISGSYWSSIQVCDWEKQHKEQNVCYCNREVEGCFLPATPLINYWRELMV